MIADRTEFAATLKAKHAERQTAMVPVAQLVQGAAVVADKLLRTPEWTRYAEYLQGYRTRMAKQKQLALDKLGDPSIVDDLQIRKLRQDIFIADVSMDAMLFAIELPAFIRKGGVEADQFIKDFERKNETAGNPKP